MVHQPEAHAVAFLPLPALSIIVQYFGRRIHDRFERIQAMFSEISARAQENFSGVRVIRAYAQEDAEIKTFETSNREYIARSLKLVRLMGMLVADARNHARPRHCSGAVDGRQGSAAFTV